MNRECERYPLFVEGELDEEGAEALDRFRQHLAGCPACRGHLLDDVSIGVRLEELAASSRGDEASRWWRDLLPPEVTAPRLRLDPPDQPDPDGLRPSLSPLRPATAAPSPRSSSTHPASLVAIGAVASAAALALVMLGPHPASRTGSEAAIAAVLERLDERTIEPRLAEFSPDRPLPLRVALGDRRRASAGGGAAAVHERLIASGEPRQAALAALLSGEPREARRKLGALAESSSDPLSLGASRGTDRRNDRASDKATGRGAARAAAQAADQAADRARLTIDRAAAALLAGEPQEAIGLLEQLPEAQAGSGAALWNRGLALRDLGLTTTAAEAFAAVAALGEKGWASEAGERQRALEREAEGREQAWRAARKRGEAMAQGGPPVDAETARDFPGITRVFFNDALRTAPDRQRVAALLPLAAILDEEFGGSVLRHAVARVLGSDFHRRRPIAAGYLRLMQRVNLGRRDIEADPQALLAAARAARQDDIALGTMVLADLTLDHAEEYARTAAALGDPWAVMLGREAQIADRIQHGDLMAAERDINEALGECERARLDYRCAHLASQLAWVDLMVRRPVEAERVAKRWYARARAAGERANQALFLQELATSAALLGENGVARAYSFELRARERRLVDPEERDRYCVVDLNLGTLLASLSLGELHPEAAATYLREAPLCGRPLHASTAELYSELLRWNASWVDAAWLRDQIHQQLGRPDRPGNRVLSHLAEGRLLSWTDPVGAVPHLRSAIAASVGRPGWDVEARAGRARAFELLAMLAARDGRWAEALDRVIEEAGPAPPGRCQLGLVLSRTELLVAYRGADGRAGGRHQMSGGERVAPSSAVDAAGLAALQGCAVVDVYARPPFHGSGEILPPSFAWRFRTGSAPPSAPRPPLGRRHLIVAATEPAPELELPVLPPFDPPAASPGETLVVVEGQAATPARALQEMTSASQIDFFAHGLVDLEVSDVSYLALSPDRDRSYALTAGQLRQERLLGAPLVVLNSCDAARPAPYHFASWSLPVAFMEAGARAVLASVTPLIARESVPFFAAVSEAIRGGAEPAVALRDARVQELSRRPDSSVAGVVLFE